MENPVDDIFRTLSLADKRVLRCAACFSGDFGEGQLTESFALEEGRTREVLEAALQSGILEQSSQAKGEKRQFRFANQEDKQSIYGSMDPLERADAHLHIGNYLMRGKSKGQLKLSESQIFGRWSQALDHFHKASEAHIAKGDLENQLRFEELQERVAQRTNELEEALEYLGRARDRLLESEKLASLGQVTAGIAHEIRNPLNFVNNFSELSIELAGELREKITELKGKVLDDKAIEALEEYLADLESNAEKIQAHGKRAESIVHNMLMHAAGGKGESSKVDLNRLIRDYALLAYHGIRGRFTDFVCQMAFELDDRVGEINIQQQDISRALLNIFQNGFQAMEEKSQSAGSDYKPILRVKSTMRDNAVEIAIRDNGPGIPEEVRARIFEPFFTTKPTGKGTGLGLSLAHELIVQGHGGELAVNSEPGEFTEFLITLPLAK
jgi:signal transduction histidine kinase